MSVETEIQNALTQPHRLFIINGVLDITENIIVPSYRVNLNDKYDEWKDNNKYTHRDITAKKIEGKFELLFNTEEEYFRFMAVTKESKKSNGSYDCSVYCNNTMEVITCEMYIDFEPINIVPYIGLKKDYEKLTVTVEQRGNQYVP